MTNLSFLSKVDLTFKFLMLLAFGNFAYEVTKFFDASAEHDMVLMTFSVLLLISSIAGFNWLSKFREDMGAALKTIEQVSEGDFEKRITHIRDKGQGASLYWKINSLIDCADAYVRESSAAMANVEQGKYYRTIMVDGLNGSYQRGAEVINGAMKSMEQKIGGFESITQSFENNVEAVIIKLSTASETLDTTAQEMDVVAGDTTNQASELTETASVTAQNVQTVSAATEELSSSISEISTQIEMSGNKIGVAVSEIHTTEGNMDELNKSVNTIGDVVALINDIANQTNLLALNATIEASRAGDAGKGFAVVANEVKALAAQTSKATTEISGLVNSIQGATKLSLESFKSVGESVAVVDEITQAIMSSIEQQNIATGEIARSIAEVSQGSVEVTVNVKKVSEGAETSQASASGLIQAAAGISAQSGTLGDEVDRFLKEVRTAM